MTLNRQQKRFVGKLCLKSTLVLKTGLHIGGGGERLDIGGLDKPVVRDPITQFPYLPGSSIKGKLRSILERFHNKHLNRAGGSETYRYESDDLVSGYSEIDGHRIRYEGAHTCQISRLFGSTGGSNFWVETSLAEQEKLERSKDSNNTFTDNNGVEYIKVKKGRNSPARLIVRDCHLEPESAVTLQQVQTGLYMTEWKFENGIDRVTAAANPRQVERVPADSKFAFELVYTVEDIPQAIEIWQKNINQDLQNIAIALSILEDDALGGHGSRGYGKVKFLKYRCYWRDIEKYRRVTKEGVDFESLILEPKDTLDLLKNCDQISSIIQKDLPGDKQ